MRRFSVTALSSMCALALAFTVDTVHAGPPTAQQIMDGVEHRYMGKDMQAQVDLQINPKGASKRVRQFTMFRKPYTGVVKLVTFIQAPADVRGAAFLAYDRDGAEDLRWLYLPTIGQVRQLAAESNRQSFFGSDFVYEDLTNRDPDLDNHTLVGSQKVGNWECWVIDSVPKSSSGLDFAKYRSWVWKDANLIVRQEFYDNSGKVVRRGQVKNVDKIQGIWTYHQGEIDNLRTGSISRMQMTNVKYDSGIPDERFTDSQLNRGLPTAP